VLSANVFAVLASIHPPQPKPMASVATTPTAAPCRSRLSDSPWYQADVGMRLSSQLGEEGFLPAAWHGRDILPILRFDETLGTPAAQAKLMVLEHYLTEGR
jgi:hypothetical protein